MEMHPQPFAPPPGPGPQSRPPRRRPGGTFVALVTLPAILAVTLQGILVAIGAPLLLGALSPAATLDGMTWRTVSFPRGTVDIRTVVAGGPGFVAAGPVAVLTSADGRSWQRVAVDDTRGASAAPWINAMISAGGRLYAGGMQQPVGEANPVAAVWTSRDGRRWTPASLPRSTRPSERQEVLAIASGPSGLVAAGDLLTLDGGFAEPLLWWSQDGNDWRLVDLAAQGVLVRGDYRFTSVAAADHGYAALLDRDGVVAPSTSDLLASPDGQHWTRVPLNAEPAPAGSGGHILADGRVGGVSGLDVLFSDQGRLLAAGLDGLPASAGTRDPSDWITPVLWESEDGARWSAVAAPPSPRGGWPSEAQDVTAEVQAVARNGEVLWAAGDVQEGGRSASGQRRAAVWGSRDGGHHWSALPDPFGLLENGFSSTRVSIRAMAVHGGVIVAVGRGDLAPAWRAGPAART